MKKFDTFFLDFEIAKELAEIGFDEPCIAWFDPETEEFNVLGQEREEGFHMTFFTPEIIQAPTREQVFEWFEEKHGLFLKIDPPFYDDIEFGGTIHKVGEYYALKSLDKNINPTALKVEAIREMIKLVSKNIK